MYTSPMSDSQMQRRLLRKKRASIWNTKSDSDAFTSYDGKLVNIDSADRRFNKKYQYISTIGDPGTYGIAVLVKNVDDSEGGGENGKFRIIKIMPANDVFVDEVKILNYVDRQIINKGLSPNFVLLESIFVARTLPPRHGGWDELHAKLGVSPTLVNMIKKQHGLIRQGEEKWLIGCIVMEYAPGGTLDEFYRLHLHRIMIRDVNMAREVVRNMIFQLLSAQFALEQANLHHRDIASMNIVVTTAAYRKALDPAFEMPLYSFGKANHMMPWPLQNEYRFVPLVIDYSLSKVVNSQVDKMLNTTVTRLSYRAPELIFFTNQEVEFYNNSDIWSFGVSILEMAIGENIFLGIDPPKEFESRIQTHCNYGKWHQSIDKQKHLFLCMDGAHFLARYLWGLVVFLGFPTNQDIPGIEDLQLWKDIRDVISVGNIDVSDFGKLWKTPNITTSGLFTPAGINVLQSMLQWHPYKRARSSIQLLGMRYFSDLFKVGKHVFENRLFTSRWGVEFLEI